MDKNKQQQQPNKQNPATQQKQPQQKTNPASSSNKNPNQKKGF